MSSGKITGQQIVCTTKSTALVVMTTPTDPKVLRMNPQIDFSIRNITSTLKRSTKNIVREPACRRTAKAKPFSVLPCHKKHVSFS